MMIVNATISPKHQRKHDEIALKENEMDLVSTVDVLDTLSAGRGFEA
jgi:hypothetical protein